MAVNPQHNATRSKNLRTAWILLSVALAFGLGFVARYWLFGHH